jgi:protein-tyrosine-phosphatase
LKDSRDDKMRILFVCAHNRFRSKVAEALFFKYTPDKKIEARSAGMGLDLMNQFVAQNVVLVLQEKGIKEIDEQSREITRFDIEWADKIVLVADNVSRNLFPANKDIKIWKISDCGEEDLEGIKKRVNEIEKKIKEFIKKLNL